MVDGLGYIHFLRDVGKHFSVNKMMSAEGIQQRLDRNQGLSFIEFNYHLLQSYDFWSCTTNMVAPCSWVAMINGSTFLVVWS